MLKKVGNRLFGSSHQSRGRNVNVLSSSDGVAISPPPASVVVRRGAAGNFLNHFKSTFKFFELGKFVSCFSTGGGGGVLSSAAAAAASGGVVAGTGVSTSPVAGPSTSTSTSGGGVGVGVEPSISSWHCSPIQTNPITIRYMDCGGVEAFVLKDLDEKLLEDLNTFWPSFQG